MRNSNRARSQGVQNYTSGEHFPGPAWYEQLSLKLRYEVQRQLRWDMQDIIRETEGGYDIEILGIKWSEKNRDSSVGIGLGYELDDRGSKILFSAGTGNFPPRHRVQTGFGTHPIFYPMGNVGSFPGRKAAGREAEYSSSSRTEVKECVDLYLRSPNTFSWRGA